MKVKGERQGTVTDAQGKFTLPKGVKRGTEVIVTYVGMQPQSVRAMSSMRVELVPSQEQLDEFLVVAFGQQKKSSFTGSAGVVKADVLNREVLTMRNTQDAACLGAAIIAGYGAGIYDSIADTALKFAEVDKVYTPNPENRAVYDRLIKKYQLLIDATHGYTEELSKEV